MSEKPELMIWRMDQRKARGICTCPGLGQLFPAACPGSAFSRVPLALLSPRCSHKTRKRRWCGTGSPSWPSLRAELWCMTVTQMTPFAPFAKLKRFQIERGTNVWTQPFWACSFGLTLRSPITSPWATCLYLGSSFGSRRSGPLCLWDIFPLPSELTGLSS